MGGYNATRSVEVYNYRHDPTRGGGDSCFSIYQISWIKIKKSKQKTSLSSEFVYVSIEGVSGIIFFNDFVANSVRIFFSTDQ